MSAADARRRVIQETVLRILRVRFAEIPCVPALWSNLLYGFSTAIVPFSEAEIREAVADLVERGFVRGETLEGTGELPDVGYHITADGRDFVDARFPWGEVHKFRHL